MNSQPVSSESRNGGHDGAGEPERGQGPVVAAFDGSAGSGHALEWALAEARLRGAPLRIVHVRSYGIPFVDGPLTPPLREPSTGDLVMDRVRTDLEGRAGLEGRTGLEARPDLPPLEYVTVDGSPGRELPRLGADAQLLVLGSRGRGGFASLLLGSNGLACAREAACPVVVVRGPSEGAADSGAVGRCGGPRVVLGLSAPAPDAAAVAFAFAAAARRGARLQVIAAYPWPVLSSTPTGDFVVSAIEDEETRVDYASLGDEVLAPHRARWPDVPVDVFVVPGDAAGHLVDASHDADLVVVGRHRRRVGPGRWLGSVTHAVLLHAGCSVGVVPPGPVPGAA
ncbi:universal stress protein [Streptomyces sp. NPDC087300]|uniref:universal stress protein n=1 Tax=Streptomyces sp. NPDC087300 TaxID=3365780 RepID=UPI003820C166